MELIMKLHQRTSDKLNTNSYDRTERIISDGLDYYYKTRDGGVSTAFDTRAAALFDLNNFILAVSLENEFKSFNEISMA